MLRYFLPVLLIAVSCSSNKNNDTNKEKAPVVVVLANEAEMDARRFVIDSITEKNGLVASSLSYAKPDGGENIQVDGHLDEKNTILKIEEFFSEGSEKNTGRRVYYLNAGKPFLIHEEFTDMSTGTPQFMDRITYYNESGKALKTKERHADFQDISETLAYKPASLYALTIDKVMRVFNQEGEFQTTFQGFIHSDVLSFLSVGENDPNGFHSQLRLDFKDPLIMALSANEEGYKGTLLRVNYQKERDNNGYEYQVYTGGKFADEE